jgi:RNA polymerase sigma-70 factor, ECF subfamily
VTIDSAPLAAAFLAQRPPDSEAGSMEDLEAALERALEAGRTAWPEVQIGGDDFAAYLGERTDPGEAPVAALSSLHLTDLYLACACASGEPRAIAALEDKYLIWVGPQVASLDASKTFADEMRQTLRIRLLMGKHDARGPTEPKIIQYRGKAKLASWLAVIATRTAIDLTKKEARLTELDEVLEVASAESPELELLRGRYLGNFQTAVKDAVVEAMSVLTPEERNLLRWHLVEKLSLRKIAALRGSNVSAMSREYARIRASIRECIVEKLRAQTGLPRKELDSLMTVLISRITLTSGLGIRTSG